jgi:hypothetical protein
MSYEHTHYGKKRSYSPIEALVEWQVYLPRNKKWGEKKNK